MTRVISPPQPAVAAIAAIALVTSSSLPPDLQAQLDITPEPYRWAMDHLGWGELDGTDWWDSVMDIIG